MNIVAKKNEKPSLKGIIFSPIKQFKKIDTNPIFLKPFFLISIISILITTIVVTKTSDIIELNRLAQEIGTTSERINVVMGILAGVFSIFTLLFNLIISSILVKLYLICIGKKLEFKKILSLNTFILFLTTLLNTVNVIINVLLNNTVINSYTNFSFLYEGSDVIKGFLKTMDITLIWKIILLTIGLKVLVNITKVQASILFSSLFIINFLLNILL